MWWIGGLIGFALGLVGEHSGFALFVYVVCGIGLGSLLNQNIDARLGGLEKENRSIHKQAAATINELRSTIANLGVRLTSFETELRQYRNSTSLKATPEQTPIVTPLTQSVTETQVEISRAAPPVATPVVARTTEQESALKIAKETAETVISTPAPIVPTTPPKPPISMPQVKPVEPRRLAPTPPSRSFRESLPAPIADFIFGGNALVKVGVLILFLGLAFLLRYAAEQITVPIEYRYVGVAMTGLGLLALGWFLRNKRRDYALSLQGMAIGVFYLTSLSALKVHHLISPEIGFAFLLAVSVLSAALAVLQNAPVLAIIAALEGFVSPILTSTGANRPLGLFTYLAVLDVGIFLVAWFNAWRVLNVIAFVGTFTLSIGWAQKFYTDSDYALVQPFLIFFFVLFAVIGVLFARRTLSDVRHDASLANSQGNPLAGIKLVGRVDSALVFGNPITAFGLQYLLVKHMEFGAAFSAIALAFFYLILARIIFAKEKQGLALLAEAYVIVAAIFGTLAIPLGLEGSWTGAAWAVEGAGMYWLGTRQARPYARAFAYVVLCGATVKLLQAMSINPLPDQPLLQGALLGPVLLGGSALTMWRLHLRCPENALKAWEPAASSLLPWLGIAAFNFLPWMLLSPPFAAASCAVLALVLTEICIRRNLPDLRPIAGVMQGVALLSFMLGLHANTDAAQSSFLQDGWRGMSAAVVIAFSLLFNAGRHMLRNKRAAEAQGLPPSWSEINSMALIAGFSLIHLSMLFAIDLRQAACIWPFTACLVLWCALWMSHGVLASYAFGLQVISAMLYLVHPNRVDAAPFMHLGFVTPIALALAAWWSGDRLRAESQRFVNTVRELAATTAVEDTGARVWLNPWCHQSSLLWLPVIWGTVWWLTAWIPEVSLALEEAHQTTALSAATVAIGIATSALLLSLAAWRRWPQMGMMSALGLPLFIYSALLGLASTTGNSHHYLPSAAWGALAWPLAALWHWYSLKRQENYFTKLAPVLTRWHVLGCWFFLALVSTELKGQFLLLSAADSSWTLLAWIIAPALFLYAVGRPILAQRWPLISYRAVYLETASAPIALVLLAWCWISNLICAGDAQPLPYLPLLNPLELAHVIVLLSLFIWWRDLPLTAAVKLQPKSAMSIVAATGFVLLTGMVLRSVHHFGGVAWNASALFDSHLAQAAISIVWALAGVGLMLAGNRRGSRTIWIAGVALLALVVAKLFLIELADRGGLYRIISFIGVGIAFLVVGYFAPVPVKKIGATAAADEAKLQEAGA